MRAEETGMSQEIKSAKGFIENTECAGETIESWGPKYVSSPQETYRNEENDVLLYYNKKKGWVLDGKPITFFELIAGYGRELSMWAEHDEVLKKLLEQCEKEK